MSIFSTIDATVICLVLLIPMPLMVKLGNRVRKRFWDPEEGETKGGISSLLGALFGLWAFILAFSFGQSGARFENLRSMIVDEANFLRNSIMKADLFPDSIRMVYRADLKRYLEERISYYDFAADAVKFKKNRERSPGLRRRFGRTTVGLTKRPEMRVTAMDMAGLFDRIVRHRHQKRSVA